MSVTPPDESPLFPLYILAPRVYLRYFELPDDLPVAHAIYSDPTVMRFSLQGPSPSLDHTRELVEGHLSSYRERGFGKWLVALRATDEPIGYCGVALTTLDGQLPSPAPEIGYRLLPAFLGQGYATEAARAALGHCFGLPSIRRILGVVEPANVASVRVLQKLGFTYARAMTCRGKAVDVYTLANPSVARSRQQPAVEGHGPPPADPA